MTEVISVRFRGGSKTYFFDPKGIQVRMGENVIVQTAQGLEFATCTQGNHEVADEAIVKPLSAIVRRATENDFRVVEYNRKRERDAFDICEGKIADHGLEMKLVNVSVGFDSNKIVFYSPPTGGWTSGSWSGIWPLSSGRGLSSGRSASGTRRR